MLSLPKHSHIAAVPCNNQFQHSIEIELIDYLFSGCWLGYNCSNRCASSFEIRVCGDPLPLKHKEPDS